MDTCSDTIDEWWFLAFVVEIDLSKYPNVVILKFALENAHLCNTNVGSYPSWDKRGVKIVEAPSKKAWAMFLD